MDKSSPKRLRDLLVSLSPEIRPGAFVFISVPQGSQQLSEFDPIGWFQEDEGISAIVPEEQARNIEFDTVFRCIKLGVHSTLDDVGLTATVSTALANAGISANVVAALHHDYIFVPKAKTEQALSVLKSLTKKAIA